MKQLSRLIVMILCLTFSGQLMAQKFLIDSSLIREYPFVMWEKNEIEFYDESPAFDQFFSKLERIYQGQSNETVNIFHIGGSHLQAGTYAHRMRRYLTQMEPHMKGERGLVFPYTLAGTNNPWNYKVDFTGEWEGFRNSVLKDEATWGMQGITAITRDSVATVKLSIRKNNVYRFDYDEFRVFHNTSDTNYVVLPVDSNQVIDITRNDSLGYTNFKLKERTETFEFKVVRMDSLDNHQFEIYGLEYKNDDPGVIYNTIGVNGSSFKSYRRCDLFEFHLKQNPPDLFIISVGTNDTYTKEFDSLKYEQYYEDFMKMIFRANPDAAVLLTVPNDSYYRKRYANPHTKTAANAIIRLAKKYKMGVWNMYEIMGGYGSSQRWYKNKLMPSDRVHFSGKGYDIKADLLLMAFLEAWDASVGREPRTLFTKHIDPSGRMGYIHERDSVIRIENPNEDQMAELGKELKYHTVRSGQSLGVIADRYGVSTADLMEWNDLSSTMIHPNDQLKVYINKGTKVYNPPPKTNVKPKNNDRSTPKGSYYYYTIKSGDNLWDIANSKGTSVEKIEALNPHLNPRNLKIGQKIKIPK